MPNNTLEKWEEKTLGEVCTITAGQSPESQFYNIEGNGLPFYQGKKEFTNKYIGAPTVWTTKITKEALAGDILMSVRAPVGPINYATQKCCIGRGLASIRKSEKISNDFLFYYLLSIQEEIGGHDGAVFNSISRNEIATLKIKLPPLSEQQRIVGILDEAFENIEKAKQNTLQNLNNAKELFESYLKKYFEIGNSTWYKYKLSEITTKIGSGATPLGGKKAYIDSGISLIRSMNVYDREFIYEGLAHINEEQAKQLNVVTIQEKDVLLNITGASVARCCVVPSDIIPARVNQHVSIIRPKQDIVSSRFLCYLLTSNYYKNKLLKDGEEGGATRQALTKMGLEQFEVYIPNTLEEQQKIVEQLDELQEQTKKLEQIYTQKLQDLDELKQSILKKAFNGEL